MIKTVCQSCITEPPPSLDVLAKDYRKLVNDKHFSDVEFIVEGKKVYGHKVILAARCDYFRAMFCDNMRECAKVNYRKKSKKF